MPHASHSKFTNGRSTQYLIYKENHTDSQPHSAQCTPRKKNRSTNTKTYLTQGLLIKELLSFDKGFQSLHVSFQGKSLLAAALAFGEVILTATKQNCFSSNCCVLFFLLLALFLVWTHFGQNYWLLVSAFLSDELWLISQQQTIFSRFNFGIATQT